MMILLIGLLLYFNHEIELVTHKMLTIAIHSAIVARVHAAPGYDMHAHSLAIAATCTY